MKPTKPRPLRSRVIDTPSPCCAPTGGVFHGDPQGENFYCTRCLKTYTLDQVLDDILDTAAKPAPGGGATSIGVDTDDFLNTGIDDTDDLLNHVGIPKKPGSGSPPRVKMVPLSRTLNTYAVKDELKAQCGAKWDHINKQWMVPEDRFALAHSIVKMGPARAAAPPTGQPRTRSQFGGLDVNDLTFEEFQKLSWTDYNAVMHENAQRQQAGVRVETRACWECGKSNTEADVKLRGGEWDNFWCGCSGK